ncbi:MAG: lipid IV(A) 3-deoxy-D-manno-octulosonic acid transferase [Gammaproteobacteria bacterium]|nr:lipid IV(A) 3-deoxy-D-manno-octulosonic acid transferase [Gammaproteobacteria bacterium]
MRILYNVLLGILFPIGLAVIAVKARRQTGHADSTAERLGYVEKSPAGPVLWVHASSVGEMQAGVPLVKALLAEYPDKHIVVTSFTASGVRRARAAFGDEVQVTPLPYDLPPFNRRFLNRIRPQALIVLETEIWPNLYREVAERDIPLLLVSARITARSVRRYTWLKSLVQDALAAVRYIGAQSSMDAERFRYMGAEPDKVHVVGNLKFDIPESAELLEQGRALRGLMFGQRPVLCAASTRVGEDEVVLEAFEKLRETHPDTALVIVPRHPERGVSIVTMSEAAGFRTALRSETENPDGVDVYVVDTIGELQAFYAASDACFVGGSLVPVGGHNLLEPASMGIPVVTGPNHQNAPDILQAMQASGAVQVVEDAPTLAAAWNRLLGDPVLRDESGERARSIVERNRGTLDAVMKDIASFLS